jgi:hypothetical protein
MSIENVLPLIFFAIVYLPSQKSPKNPALHESHLLVYSGGRVIITPEVTPISSFCAKMLQEQPLISQVTS